MVCFCTQYSSFVANCLFIFLFVLWQCYAYIKILTALKFSLSLFFFFLPGSYVLLTFNDGMSNCVFVCVCVCGSE